MGFYSRVPMFEPCQTHIHLHLGHKWTWHVASCSTYRLPFPFVAVQYPYGAQKTYCIMFYWFLALHFLKHILSLHPRESPSGQAPDLFRYLRVMGTPYIFHPLYFPACSQTYATSMIWLNLRRISWMGVTKSLSMLRGLTQSCRQLVLFNWRCCLLFAWCFCSWVYIS